MRLHHRATAPFAVLAGATISAQSCSADTTAPQPACTGAAQVAVDRHHADVLLDAGLSLFFINVEPTAAGADQWNVISDSTNAIQSPVQYGVVPTGARRLTAIAAPLLPGVSYTVYVFRWTGPGSQDGVLIGSQAFTP